jgi:hypothetical protein
MRILAQPGFLSFYFLFSFIFLVFYLIFYPPFILLTIELKFKYIMIPCSDQMQQPEISAWCIFSLSSLITSCFNQVPYLLRC